MNTTLKSLFSLLALLAGIHQAAAQSTEFTYQGRVTDNGTNFTGTGQFKFSVITYSNLNVTATAANAQIIAPGGYGTGTVIPPITLINGGSGYLTPPTVTIPGSDNIGPDSNATATATISGGMVTAINLISGGYGYISYPPVIISPPPVVNVPQTLWNNDGTGIGEPSAAVTVGVTNGLFTVILGNTNLPNMTAIPGSLFSQYAYPNLGLEIWFNDGVNGFALLNPVQPLTPAPTATFANTASNLLGALPANQLTGAIAPSLLTSVPASSLSGTINAASLTGPVPSTSLTSVPAGSLTGTLSPAVLGATNSFTPTIGDGTHNFSTSVASGYYAVVGNLVYFEDWLVWTGRGSAVTSDNLRISLPPGFPVASSRAAFTLAYFNGVSFNHQLVAYSTPGLTYFLLDDLTSGGAAAGIPVSNCGTSGEVQITGFYRWQ
jgi:hypothetical protein